MHGEAQRNSTVPVLLATAKLSRQRAVDCTICRTSAAISRALPLSAKGINPGILGSRDPGHFANPEIPGFRRPDTGIKIHDKNVVNSPICHRTYHLPIPLNGITA